MRLPTRGEQAGRIWAALRASVDAAYAPTTHAMPPAAAVTREGLRPLQEQGGGLDALPEVWADMVAGSAKLASPWCMGHMDTAPHPAAALTDALVSSLNNNLLFREISPLASVVEEALIEEFATLLGLPPTTRGIWASGGSLANLSAMFAAAGGYSANAPPRHEVTIVMGERGHVSVSKASRVLGVPLVSVPAADAAAGCVDTARLEDAVVTFRSPQESEMIICVSRGGSPPTPWNVNSRRHPPTPHPLEGGHHPHQPKRYRNAASM